MLTLCFMHSVIDDKGHFDLNFNSEIEMDHGKNFLWEPRLESVDDKSLF